MRPVLFTIGPDRNGSIGRQEVVLDARLSTMGTFRISQITRHGALMYKQGMRGVCVCMSLGCQWLGSRPRLRRVIGSGGRAGATLEGVYGPVLSGKAHTVGFQA